MKSVKDESLMDLQKENPSISISPSKKKKRPKPFMAFSSFARCNLFSHVKSPNPNSDSSNPKPSKTPKQIEDSDSDSEQELEESEEEEDQIEETIEVDFEFFDPKESDFHGVKLLLQNYLDKFQWDLSGFIDLILSQSTVGTVVKSADSETDNSDSNNNNNDNNNDSNEGEIFALISVLNFGRYKENKCMKELKQYLVSICKDENTKNKLVKLLEEEEEEKYLGLIICQRFMNCPYQLVLKLYEALFDEINWAIEDEPTQEIQDSYKFQNYILITKIFVNNNNRSEKRNGKRKVDGNEEEPIIYVKEEDEIFREICSWSFMFELSSDDPMPSDLKNYKKMGLVMVVKAEDISKFRNKFKFLVEG